MKKRFRWITRILVFALCLSMTPAAVAFGGEEDTVKAQDTIQETEVSAQPEKAEAAVEVQEPAGTEQTVDAEPSVTAEPQVASEPADVTEPVETGTQEVQAEPEQNSDTDVSLEQTAESEALLGEEEEGSGSGEQVSSETGTAEGGEDESDPDNKTQDEDKDEGDPSKPEDEPEEEHIDLAVTNNTNMFKVVTAYVENKEDTMELVVALSGSTYNNLIVATYEQAAAIGYNPDYWIKSFKDENGKVAFRIPIDENTSYLPIISVSDTYLNGYLSNKNTIERSFYARQFVLDLAGKTLTTGDYEFTQALTVTNKSDQVKTEAASLYTQGGPNNNSYKSNLIVKMADDAFDAAYIGSKAKAKAAKTTFSIGEDRLLTLPVKWLATFGKPETMTTLIGSEFKVSLRSSEDATWSQHTFLINEEDGKLVINTKKSSKKKKEEEEEEDDPVIPGQDDDDPSKGSGTNGTTSVVDNDTSLKDGTYTQDKFSFSGGTGKIVISCNQVEVKNGKAYATIVFSNVKSGTAEFSYVKANGSTYYCTQVGGTSVVTIPVELNQNNTILGLTTKMSAAHEIAYTIFVYISGAEKQKGSELNSNKELDKEAPVIAGLEYSGEEKVDAAELFKVFNYSDGIRLLEVDMRTEEEKADSGDDAEKKDSDDGKGQEENSKAKKVIDEDTGEEVVIPASKAEAQAELYKGNVIKYLLVPEKVEIPAGLDKEAIVITIPADSIYSGSDAVTKIMEKLKIDKLITSQEKEAEGRKAAGSFKDLSLKTLVQSKCDMVLISDELLDEKDGREVFASQAEDLANLDIVLLMDRSGSEKTEKAKAEWLKVYGMLFGCEEAAQQAYEAVQ